MKMLINPQPMIRSAVQGIAIFIGVQFFMSQFMGKKSAPTTAVVDESGTVIQVPANTAEIPPFLARPDSLAEGSVYNPIPQRIAPMWPADTPLDITIVVSPSFVSEPLAKVPKERRVADEISFRLGDYKENRVIDTEFDVPKEVQNNGTLWAHFYIGLTGSKLDPATKGYDSARAFHFIHPLTQYIAQKKVKKTKNLLAAKEDDEEVSCVSRFRFICADRLLARGRNSCWSYYYLALPPQLYYVSYPRHRSHAISKLKSRCSPIRALGSDWSKRCHWTKRMVLPSAIRQHILAT
jgi:hypothetical protein